MNKPYAIFDMDGTLVDSMGFWKRLAFEYLESHGVKKVSAEILERIKAMTMTESAALFICEYGLLRTPESVAADMNTMMDDAHLVCFIILCLMDIVHNLFLTFVLHLLVFHYSRLICFFKQNRDGRSFSFLTL